MKRVLLRVSLFVRNISIALLCIACCFVSTPVFSAPAATQIQDAQIARVDGDIVVTTIGGERRVDRVSVRNNPGTDDKLSTVFGPQANTFDGSWSGETDIGRIGFDVINNNIEYFRFEIDRTKVNCFFSFELFTSIPIFEDSFSYSPPLPFITEFRGTFASMTGASGSLSYNIASCDVQGTSEWTATSTAPAYILTPTRATLEVTVGQSATQNLSVLGFNGFSAPVSLSVLSLSNIQANVSPASLTPGQTATLTVNAMNTNPGLYSILVSSTSPGFSRSSFINVTVRPVTGFEIARFSGGVTVPLARGESTSLISLVIYVRANGFADPITLSAQISPPTQGVALTITNGPDDTVVGIALIEVDIGPDVPSGTYDVTLNAEGGGLRKSSTFSIDLAREFQLQPSLATVFASKGDKIKVDLNIDRLGDFSGPVTVDAIPPSDQGIRVKPNQKRTRGDKVKFKVIIDEGAASGTHQLVFSGSSGPNGPAQRAILQLIVD